MNKIVSIFVPRSHPTPSLEKAWAGAWVIENAYGRWAPHAVGGSSPGLLWETSPPNASGIHWEAWVSTLKQRKCKQMLKPSDWQPWFQSTWKTLGWLRRTLKCVKNKMSRYIRNQLWKCVNGRIRIKDLREFTIIYIFPPQHCYYIFTEKCWRTYFGKKPLKSKEEVSLTARLS